MINTDLIPNVMQTAWKNLDANGDALSERRLRGGPYAYTQWLQNAWATEVAVSLTNGTHRVSLEKRSVMTNRNFFSCGEPRQRSQDVDVDVL